MMNFPTSSTKFQTVPITQTQLKTYHMPTICSQLPLRFENGHVFKQFEGTCSGCGRKVEAKDLHGSIVQPIKSVAVIDAVGFCRSCEIFVPFFNRVKDDGTILTRDSGGNWVTGWVKVEKEGNPLLAKVLAFAVAGTLALCFNWLRG